MFRDEIVYGVIKDSFRIPASLQNPCRSILLSGWRLCWVSHFWWNTYTWYAYECLRMSVVQVLFLPCGGGDCTVGVHDHLGAADDHGHQQKAEEGDAGQSQALVHIHEGWLCCALHLHDGWCLLLLLLLLSSDTPTHPAVILKARLEIHRQRKEMDMLSHIHDRR